MKSYCFICVAMLCSGTAWCAEEPGMPVYYFDMTGLHDLDRQDPVQARRAWDMGHLVASVQGIVNRDANAPC